MQESFPICTEENVYGKSVRNFANASAVKGGQIERLKNFFRFNASRCITMKVFLSVHPLEIEIGCETRCYVGTERPSSRCFLFFYLLRNKHKLVGGRRVFI